jgi:hypothetical protein
MAAREPNGDLRIESYDLSIDESLTRRLDVVPLIDRQMKVRRYGYWWRGVPPVVESGYPLTAFEVREALATELVGYLQSRTP